MQQQNGLLGRETAAKKLSAEGLSQELIEAISYCVSNDGILTASRGAKVAITELSTS